MVVCCCVWESLLSGAGLGCACVRREGRLRGVNDESAKLAPPFALGPAWGPARRMWIGQVRPGLALW